MNFDDIIDRNGRVSNYPKPATKIERRAPLAFGPPAEVESQPIGQPDTSKYDPEAFRRAVEAFQAYNRKVFRHKGHWTADGDDES